MSFNNYQKYKGKLQEKHYSTLEEAEKIGYGLKAKQKVVSTAMMILHKCFSIESMEQDRIILQGMSFLLSFKINDIHRSLEDILLEIDKKTFFLKDSRQNSSEKILSDVKDNIQNQELLFCIETNFEFQYINYYDYLITKANEFFFEKDVLTAEKIILNDSFYLPLFLFYNKKSIIYSALYIAAEIYKIKQSIPKKNEEITKFEEFVCELKKKDPSFEFVSHEILDFYLSLYA